MSHIRSATENRSGIQSRWLSRIGVSLRAKKRPRGVPRGPNAAELRFKT
jgi:hypothetical protein